MGARLDSISCCAIQSRLSAACLIAKRRIYNVIFYGWKRMEIACGRMDGETSICGNNKGRVTVGAGKPAMAPATKPLNLLSSTVGSDPLRSNLKASYEAKFTACRPSIHTLSIPNISWPRQASAGGLHIPTHLIWSGTHEVHSIAPPEAVHSFSSQNLARNCACLCCVLHA